MMLPGALKYGDLPAFLALGAPGKANVFNSDLAEKNPAAMTYAALGKPDALTVGKKALTAAEVAAWLKGD